MSGNKGGMRGKKKGGEGAGRMELGAERRIEQMGVIGVRTRKRETEEARKKSRSERARG